MTREHDHLPEDLQFRLRGLRRESMPANDLWPGIAERISAQPQVATHGNVVTMRRRNTARFAPWALAASLALAVGVAWQLRPAPDDVPASPSTALIEREAAAMTLEYDAALRELRVADAPASEGNEALRQLDRSAAQIRSAMARDPGAHFLLDRLRSTYEKRLQLTRRLPLT